MTKPSKWVVLGAKVLVLAGLVYVIRKQVDPSSFAALFTDLHAGYFVLALALIFLVPVIMALRLGYVSGENGLRLIPCLIKSYFFNNLFPAQIGGDLYKIVRLSQLTGEKKRSVAYVVSDRVMGMTGVTLLAVINVALGASHFTDERIHTGIAVYVVAVAIFFAGVFLVPERGLELIGRMLPIGSLMDKLRAMRGYARETFRTRLPGGIGLTLVAYYILVAANICAMQALGLGSFPLISALYIPVIAIVVVTLPISFNGLGVRESLFILFFSMAGFSNEESLALAAVNLAGVLLVSIVGGLMVLASRTSPKRVRAEADQV